MDGMGIGYPNDVTVILEMMKALGPYNDGDGLLSVLSRCEAIISPATVLGMHWKKPSEEQMIYNLQVAI